MKHAIITFAAMLLAPPACLAQQPQDTQISASFDKEGRSVSVTTPGLSAFSSRFSALVEVEGEKRVLSSAVGTVQPVTNSTESTPYGEATVATSTIHFEQEHLDLMLRLGQVSGVPGVLFQAGIRNAGQKPVKLSNVTPVQSGITLEGDPADWLVTRISRYWKQKTPGAVFALGATNSPLEVQETGAFYRRDGRGFLFAPVGDPIAYIESTVTYTGKDRTSLDIVSLMSGVRVDPGETRWGQQAALLMEKPHDALVRAADWVAQTHHARTDKGSLHGWCSWYLKTSKITGEDVLGIVNAVKKSPDRLRPAVIQIDDGYQDIDGIWDANAKFPEGMPFYAKRIAETGARPGLWMALTMMGGNAPWVKNPVNLEAVWGKRFNKGKNKARIDATGWLDPTHPAARAHIADRVRHAVESGFTYLKLDFNNIGGGGWYEKKRTSFEIMRDHYTNIRMAAGEGTYIQRTGGPDRASVGLVDASRTSEDAHRGGIRNSIGQVLRAYELNGRWFAVDNDCYYTVAEPKGAGKVAGGEPIVRTYASMMGLSSGAAFTSDLWQWEAFKPYWRMTEIMTPPAKERTEVMDLCTGEEWPRLLSKVQRPWGNWFVALLWNPGTQEQTVTLDFAKAGLDPAHRYAVWSFWDDRFLGIAKGQWVTPSLPAGGCQHLVLTDLESHPGQPVVIGSNLHIFCGAAEIKNVNTTPTGIDIELTDAGAREGDLFLYSQKPLTSSTATGCTVKTVEAAGDNVWKIHLEGRESGKPQRVNLKGKI